MELTGPTLCFPDHKKTCFACCPPIRPAGYEHLEHKNIVQRILRENTEAFCKGDERIFSITGFNCWALGYLDENHKLIGCLLHPAQNGGFDLRHRVDYGEKCRRETCPQAKVFSELSLPVKDFWLHLAHGLESFSYSSRRINPLFHMIDWGSYLLNLIASEECNRVVTRESFFQSYPFFSSTFSPKANAYLINRVISKENVHLLRNPSFGSAFEAFSGFIEERLSQITPSAPDAPFVHLLNLDPHFTYLLRLLARISRITRKDALILKNVVDEEILSFKRSL